MSQPSAAQQAIEWLQQQLNDLNGIRNATPRDPSFKNWRQATLTAMQRIWPNDQDRQERFRRIPFSPADPRADARTVREWYSRGCQEAARVLTGFVTDIQAQGVPQPAADVAAKPTSAEFTVDFPTVDLPSGNVPTSTPMPDEADDMLQLGPSPSGSTPKVPVAPTLQNPTPPPPPVQAPAVFETFRPGPTPVSPAAPKSAPPAPVHAQAPAAPVPPPSSQSSAPVAQPKKGMGARLRDLLGFAQMSAKAFTGAPREDVHARPAPPPRFEVQAVGEDLTALNVPSPMANVVPPPPIASAPPALSTPPLANTPPAMTTDEMREPGASVVMSRPTTLRANIEKVSIESLISPEFRNAEDAASTPVSPSPAPPIVAATPAPLAADPLDVPHLSPVVEPASPTASEPPPAPPVVNEAPPELDPVAQTIADAIAAQPAPPVVPVDVSQTFATTVLPTVVPEELTPLEVSPVVEATPIAAEPVVPPAPVTPVESVAPASSTPAIVTTTATSSGVFPLPTPSGTIATPSGGFPRPTVHVPSSPAEDEQPVLAPPPADALASPSTIIPLPAFQKSAEPTGEKSRSKRESTPKVLPFTKRVPEPVAKAPEAEDAVDANEMSEVPVDPQEIAQATEDFMRTSPVLGATGRKVKRDGYDEPKREQPVASAHEDPDAIAVLGMLDELDELGVPKPRLKEARARLEDLAKRIEKGDLEWAALRKAVWFAMEYPELARRLMPLLLPWIDRAA